MAHDASRFPLAAYQPFKFFTQLSHSAMLIFRLPFYALRSVFPFLRPHSKWTAKQSFLTLVTYRLLDLTSRIGLTPKLSLEPGKEGKRFQLVKPATPNYYLGPLDSKTVKPATIGGTWYPAPPTSNIVHKTVLLYFHGGAYVQGDGRDENCKPIANMLLDRNAVDAMFSVQYRLSGYGNQDPFPAALQDALSAYVYLLNDLQIPGSHIVFGGDSAGAHLALGLVRYVTDFGPSISVPNPKCALLMSPWLELFYFDFSHNENYGTDFIPESFARWGAEVFAGSHPHPETDPYITPLGNPFQTAIPIFANAGSVEILYWRVLKFVDEMRRIGGNKIEINSEVAAPHDTFLVGEMLGFQTSAQGVATKVKEFIDRH